MPRQKTQQSGQNYSDFAKSIQQKVQKPNKTKVINSSKAVKPAKRLRSPSDPPNLHEVHAPPSTKASKNFAQAGIGNKMVTIASEQ